MKLTLILWILLAALVTANARPVTVTAYCPCKRCCGPKAAGITASGRRAEAGVTIAAARAIPFGTMIDIPGLGVRRVDDRLAKRFDSRIDVFFSTHKEALNFGKRIVDIN